MNAPKPQRQRKTRTLPVRIANEVQNLADTSAALARNVSSAGTSVGAQKSRPRGRRRRGRGGKNRGGRGNPFLRALIDPEDCKGCKVPDVASYNSQGFQVSFDNTITSNATGEAAQGYSVSCDDGANGTMISTVAAGVITWTTGSAYPWGTPVNAVFNKFRPVSAVFKGEFIGSTSNDQGQVIVGLVPRTTAFPATVALALSAPDSVVFPVRDGFRTLWRPMDNRDHEYHPCTDQGFNVVNPPDCQFHPGWFVVVTGVAASTVVLRLRVVINFEGIPSSDVADFVGATPSPVDLQSFQGALAKFNDLPLSSTWTSWAGTAAGVGGALLQQYLVSRVDAFPGRGRRRNGYGGADMV